MADGKKTPNLFIVGAPKCGTTAMHTYLGSHPEIFMAKHKENNHFATDLLPPDDPFRDDGRYFSMFEGGGSRKVIGESSVFYLLSKTAALNIHRFNPEAKIIIMLREPADMLQSYHAQMIYNRDEDIIDFKAALDAENKRKSGQLKIKDGLRFNERLFYSEVVAYTEQVRRYLSQFPEEQIMIIIYDDLKADTAGVYKKTLEFLNVDPSFKPAFPVINSRKAIIPETAAQKPHLVNRVVRSLSGLINKIRVRVWPGQKARDTSAGLRRSLKKKYSLEIEKLGALIGVDLEYWNADGNIKKSARPGISTWENARERLIPNIWPEIIPSFKIAKQDKIFTIGSCFARNIEEHLVKCGFDVPMMSFSVPKHEWPNRPNGILNKYSPVSIFQELAWCDRIHAQGGRLSYKDIEELLYECGEDSAIDLHIGGYVPVTKARALARRQEIYDVFKQAFNSRILIMTLGLIEVWRDLKNGLFIQRAPSEIMMNDPRRFEFTRLSLAECVDHIRKSIGLIRKYQPDVKCLISVSPVPLKETFTKEDVICANMYSKSVLRAACGEIVSADKAIDYFPSYENVAGDQNAYEADLRHVSDKYISKIVDKMTESYLEQG